MWVAVKPAAPKNPEPQPNSDTATPEITTIPLYSSAEQAAAATAKPSDATTSDPVPSDPVPSDTDPSEKPAPPAMTLKEAVLTCRGAYKRAYSDELAISKSEYAAGLRGAEAFRNAMPLLTSRGNIQAFIACIAHGSLIGAISAKDAPRLIASARLALLAIPSENSSDRGRRSGNEDNQKNNIKKNRDGKNYI